MTDIAGKPEMTPALETAAVQGAASSRWMVRLAVPLFLLALLAWAAYLLWNAVVSSSNVEDPSASAARIQSAFERQDFERVERDAEALLKRYPNWAGQGEVQLLAAKAAYERGSADPEGNRAAFERACALAGSSVKMGLVGKRAAAALEVVARSEMALGDYAQVLAVWGEVYVADRDSATGLLLLKAEAEFRMGRPDLGVASYDAILRNPNRTDDRWVAALLVKGDGMRINGKPAEAEKAYRAVIDSFPKSARVKDAQFGMGLMFFEQSKSNPALRETARRWFDASLTARYPANEALDRKAAFLSAECLRSEGDADATVGALRRVTASWPGTPEGISAALRIASLEAGRGRFDAAREALGSALDQVGDNGRLTSAYISAEEVSALWGTVLKHFLDAGEYETLASLCRGAEKLAQRDVYRVQQAELLRRHARTLRDEAAKVAAEAKPGATEAASVRLEEARLDYGRAAELLLKVVHGVNAERKVYDVALASAADSLYEAGRYADAAVYYRLCLKDAGGRRDVIELRLQYARALAALGRHAEAATEFSLIIDQAGRAPAAYEAMLARAESYRALGAWDNAEQAFEAIVSRPNLFSPTGRLWRRALVELGYSLYRGGRYRDAARRFDEALDRPGCVEGTPFSRAQVAYYLGDSWRSIGSPDPTARREELAQAARRFAEARTAAASPRDAELCRRSLSAEAACRYELDDYRGALALYREAAETYLDGADGVGALYGAAACLGRLGEKDAAAETLKRAQWCHARLRKERAGEISPFLEDSWNALASRSVVQ